PPHRVGLGPAHLHAPHLPLASPPTARLDPQWSRQAMRLLVELAEEHELAAIINSRDVALAKQFESRIVGLRAGEVVFDRPPGSLTEDVLSEIYGLEDWSQTARRGGGGDAARDAADDDDDEDD